MVAQLAINSETKRTSHGGEPSSPPVSSLINPVQLRDIQLAVKQELYRSIKQGYQRYLVVAPCAFGKTVLAASITYDASIIKQKKTLFVVPYTCLTEQTAKVFESHGIEAGIIAGGYKENRDCSVQIATIQTLAMGRDISWLNPDVVILDECHIISYSRWSLENFPPLKEEINSESQSNNLLIGLTATPWRLSKRESMGDIFEVQVLAPTPKEMIALGYLVPIVCYGIKGADLKGIRTTAGDYNLGDLDVKCSDLEVIQSAVDNYLKICPNRIFIAFACTKRHAKLLMEEFNRKGVKTALVTDETPHKIRQILYKDLKTGAIQGITNVDCTGIGFDVPEVSCILDCRPTKSKALAIQHWGRGQRLAPKIDKTDCILLDQAGNVKRHGFIEDITYPSLRASIEKDKAPPPVKNCPECDLLIHLSIMTCPECGYKFPIKEKEKPVGELKLIVKPEIQPQYDFYRRHLKSAYHYGFSPAWAFYKTVEQFNLELKTRRLPKIWGLNAIFGENATYEDKQEYLRYLEDIANKKLKDGRWIRYYFTMEFGC